MMDVAEDAEKFIDIIHRDVLKMFDTVNDVVEHNQKKVIEAMQECKVSERHFSPSTGYGYSDDGRDTLDRLFALVFGSEAALVSPQWASGTHVLSDCLYSILRPGDTMLSITGAPYDTLGEVIGIDEEGNNCSGSLKDWGIGYKQVELQEDDRINIEKVEEILKSDCTIKLVFMQRSKGYSWRNSIDIDEMEMVISKIRKINPHIIIMVDNCYGEFTELKEPCHVGADIAVGSLIKNPGGGLAPTGAYVVGNKNIIERVAYRHTAPGIGREVGSYAASYLPFYQGIFMAPHIVGEALKGAILGARLFQELDYEVAPLWDSKRTDIIQSIKFEDKEQLITFCQSIQAASPVDGYVVPYPWDMPGYADQVIMAAGTFIQGASIELSADAPIRPPYIAYMQGGLTYSHVKIALTNVLCNFIDKGYVKI